MARTARRVARIGGTADDQPIIGVDDRVLIRFGTARLLEIWISTSRGAAERSFKRWHNDFNLLMRCASAKKLGFARATALEHAPNRAQRGKIFCANEKFSQKRVAQFRQLRTTNHQVTSVFTHFKFQLVNTRTFDSVEKRNASYRSYLGLVASFPG